MTTYIRRYRNYDRKADGYYDISRIGVIHPYLTDFFVEALKDGYMSSYQAEGVKLVTYSRKSWRYRKHYISFKSLRRHLKTGSIESVYPKLTKAWTPVYSKFTKEWV